MVRWFGDRLFARVSRGNSSRRRRRIEGSKNFHELYMEDTRGHIVLEEDGICGNLRAVIGIPHKLCPREHAENEFMRKTFIVDRYSYIIVKTSWLLLFGILPSRE